jgi:hypothetical protein
MPCAATNVADMPSTAKVEAMYFMVSSQKIRIFCPHQAGQIGVRGRVFFETAFRTVEEDRNFHFEESTKFTPKLQ